MQETVMLPPDIDAARLARVTTLARGAHASLAAGVCAMEAVAYVAGEPHSDHPACACPVLGAFVKAWNDGLPQAERDVLILPLLTRLVDTRGSAALRDRRATMAADWLVRVHAPAWLRLAGLPAHADALASLPEIVDFADTSSLPGLLEAARQAAAIAGADGTIAEGDPAGDAARAAASAAAGPVAWVVAGTAADDAARAASKASLQSAPIRSELQRSALILIERMIDARDVA